MIRSALLLCLSATVAIGAGCAYDYDHERPDVGDTVAGDRRIQSRDVVEASDRVAEYLLQLPEFNGPTRKTMVVTAIDNMTSDPFYNYDIFIQRLRTNLGQYGRDRIMLIENRERVQGLRNDELEGPVDTFGQGDGSMQTPPTSVQPEFALYGKITEMPNRETRYYFCEFTVTNLKTREQIPLRPFEVKVRK
jgi:hypothetical protein